MLTEKEQLDLDLPEHVVLNILCRLQVKSLIRFTCVSKRWRSLIVSDIQFANSHFHLASHLRQNVLIATHPASLPSRFRFLDDNFSIRNLTLWCGNGLLQWIGSFRHPSRCLGTSRWIIPSPSFRIGMVKLADEKEKMCMSCVYYGFGQVSASDDYKLVAIPQFGRFIEVHVFSVPELTVGKLLKLLSCRHTPSGLKSKQWGTHSNGAIHWVSQREPGIFEPPVYAFDLTSEEFREMSMPVLSHNEDSLKMRRMRTPVLSGGCLCVLFQDDDECSEFWAMKEYGVPKSWAKLFRFNVRDLPDVFSPFFSCYFWDPIFLAEKGTVVITLPKKMELVRIKCCKDLY